MLFVKSEHEAHGALVCPHCNSTGWRSFQKTDRQPAVHASPTFMLPYMRDRADDAGICWYVPMNVSLTHRSLDLQAFARGIERVDGGFGENARDDTGDGI